MSRFCGVHLALVLLVVGCSEDASNYKIENRDGVPHVINRGTNVWTDTAAAPLQFEREQTYGTKEGSGPALLGSIPSLTVDDSGTVFMLDGSNHRLVAFNPDGTVRWSAGREGEGPGEFQDPRGMALGTDGHLFIADNQGRAVDRWTTAGELLDQHSFEETDLSFLDPVGFAENHLIVSETGFGETPQTIHTLDPETWAITHSFPLTMNLDLPEGLATSASATTVGDNIYVSGITEYALSQYAIDGTLTRRITREVNFLLGPGTYERGGSRGIRTYSGLRAPLRLPGGHLLVVAWWASNVEDPDAHYRRSQTNGAEEIVPATVLDLFAPNGRYRGSLRWTDRYNPPIGSPRVVGPNGKLYTTSTEPFPQVRRYEVTADL